MASKPKSVQDPSKDQVKLQNIEFQEGWVKNRTEKDSLQKEGRHDSMEHGTPEGRIRTMKITDKILLDIAREERKNVCYHYYKFNQLSDVHCTIHPILTLTTQSVSTERECF